METLKLEPMMWIDNRHEIAERNAKANAYSESRAKRIARNKRIEALKIIGGALIGAPLLYAAMLSVCIIF